MSAGYEAGLAAEADDLADEAQDLAEKVTADLGGARRAGLDPDAVRPVVGAALALGAAQLAVYNAGRDGTGAKFADDRHFLSAIADDADAAADLLTAAGTCAARLRDARADARADHDPDDPDDDTAERVSICNDALMVLAGLAARLQHAIDRLDDVPAALGETYESVYSLVRSGGQMPHAGRWITGDDNRPFSHLARLSYATRRSEAQARRPRRD